MDKCPICNLELRIIKNRTVLENDNTPDAPTEVYAEMDMACHNKNCANFDKVLETKRIPIEIG